MSHVSDYDFNMIYLMDMIVLIGNHEHQINHIEIIVRKSGRNATEKSASICGISVPVLHRLFQHFPEKISRKARHNEVCSHHGNQSLCIHTCFS